MKKLEECKAKVDAIQREFDDVMDRPHAPEELDEIMDRMLKAQCDLTKALHEYLTKIAGPQPEPIGRAFNFSTFIDEH